MSDKQRGDSHRIDYRSKSSVRRRTFIAVGGGVGASMLAGCTSNDGPDESADGTQTDDGSQTDDGTQSGDSTGVTHDGNFRLLISDQPADIGDFERLDVTLDYARIFDGNGDADDDEGEDEDEDEQSADGDESDGSDTEDGGDEDGSEENDSSDERSDAEGENEETESEDDNEDAGEDDSEGVERKRGFYIVDLEGRTVDLTNLVGERAVSVFEGELSPGTYRKIELHVSSVEGIVDGEEANVKLPSEKLQITHSFEIGADDPVDFVFDINVVKRGQGSDYNLKPVISESGVAGKDVEVEEVGRDDDGEAESEDEGEQEDEEADDQEDADEGGNDESERSDSDESDEDEAGGSNGEDGDDSGDEEN